MRNTTFGQLLRDRRKAAGATMGEIARVLGVTVPYVSDVERGRRAPFSKEKIELIAMFLKQDAGELHRAAALVSGSFRLDTSVSDKGREVGAALMRGWTGLSDDELDAIAKIVSKRTDK